jgi:hypothetical protein
MPLGEKEEKMFVLLDFPTMDPCLEDYIFVISLHESYSGISKTVHGHRTLESPACFFSASYHYRKRGLCRAFKFLPCVFYQAHGKELLCRAS